MKIEDRINLWDFVGEKRGGIWIDDIDKAEQVDIRWVCVYTYVFSI